MSTATTVQKATLRNGLSVHAARVSAPHRPQPGNIVSARTRPLPAPAPAATTTVGTVVQAAVDARFITDTPSSRQSYARTVAADASKAVIELVAFRHILAGSTPRAAAPVPAGREPNSRPATATPSTEPQYPSGWAPATSQLHPGGFRTARAAKIPLVRAAQTVLAPGDTRSYLEAQAKVAADNQAQAQRGINAHTDPHTLIASASAPAQAQQAAERAELDRRAAAHARRYGR